MTSRLDRLFILLESGSSAVTRRAAAKQIGEVQKLYPHELHALLNRLIGYLHSSSWDTRIAAAQTVEAILLNVPVWKPEVFAASNSAIKREIKKDDLEEDSCQSTSSASSSIATVANSVTEAKNRFLLFNEFNLEQILNKGARLIGSEGAEFDMNEDGTSIATKAEHLSQQRAMLKEKLDLAQILNISEMITDEDMCSNTATYNINDEKVPVESILNIKPNHNLIPSNGQQLSCREMNRAKRKARQNMSSASVTTTVATSTTNTINRSTSLLGNNGIKSDEPEKKKFKSDPQRQEIFYSLNDPVPDATGTWIDATNWPLENFCARLYLDLFNPKWEIRHGAATALRELILIHSKGAGKSINMTKEEMENNHSLWLEDAALRLLCVLCLDRFGDFVSDQVVAPVRETCSQVLGLIVKEMEAEQVYNIVDILLKLLKENEWEVRHGGLLGLKYVFVVRQDLLEKCLPRTINDVLIGLFDTVDDVGAVAASTLTPVALWLPKLLTAEQVSKIVKMLWDLLLDQDELTSACNSFMGLLAALLCLPNASSWLQMEPMSTVVPRLWPFLSHNSSSVRKSTLMTLKTLSTNNAKTEYSPKNVKTKTELVPENASSIGLSTMKLNFDSKNLTLNFGVIDWQPKLLQEALRHIYQRILVESQTDIHQLTQLVWMNLITNANIGALLHAACPYVSSWICLAMQPQRLAFDPAALIQATPTSDASLNRRRIQRSGDDLGCNILTSITSQKVIEMRH
ncbi:TATA-binding protein-associated factor 172-like [Teleopsis dalmanni]|uniref:TATA-binding protein-associated factor 172-like n=1 Tax=Teleopsis dalmanni TaxID=139649 RepID=UPI0018CCDCC2|nr:TATA-binding protein-associated factor 172-like [Teleopsis dalmanni]